MSARPRCWITCLIARWVACRDRRGRGVRDGACLQRPASTLRSHAGSPRPTSRPPARRTRHGLRPTVRPGARPVPGRAGHADASSPRSPSNSRSFASWTMRSGSTTPPHRSWGSLPVACTLSESRWSVPRARASATRRWRGCLKCRSSGSTSAMRAHSCWRTCTARSMLPSATRSSPRATATRSRCSSCRAPGTPQTSRAGSVFPAASRSPGRSNRATPAARATSVRDAAARSCRGG